MILAKLKAAWWAASMRYADRCFAAAGRREARYAQEHLEPESYMALVRYWRERCEKAEAELAERKK